MCSVGSCTQHGGFNLLNFTDGHLLLPGTIFGDTKLMSCSWSAAHAGQWCVTCVNSVFSMQPQCLHSLHPLTSLGMLSVGWDPILLYTPVTCSFLGIFRPQTGN